MSRFRITWESYDGPAAHGRAWYRAEQWLTGTADDLREHLAAMEAAGNITNIEADLDPTTWAPTDPVDRFRLVYAQYSAGEFSVSIADELTIPRASDGFDCPTYGMAYTTTDDGEHDLQVLCVPSELVRVYLVDWQEVHADHFSDLDEMTDSMAESGFEDYIGDCEMYGEQAGIITEEE